MPRAKRQANAEELGVFEKCEQCGAPVVRDPSQPPLCAGCAPVSPAAAAIYKVLAVCHARRGTLPLAPEVRRVLPRAVNHG